MSRALARRFFQERPYLLGLVAVMLIGTLVRAALLDTPMRYDETFTYGIYAIKPLSQALTDYSEPNNHLFHTLLVHLTCSLSPHEICEPWLIRTPALLAGILLIPAIYLLARLFYDAPTALFSAGLVAGLAYLIEYSTDARGYTLYCLFFVLALSLLAHVLRHRARWAWLLFALLSVLMLYTIPATLYGVGALNLWFLWCVWWRDTNQPIWALLRRWLVADLLAAALTVLFYLPVVAASGLQALVGNRVISARSWAAFLSDIAPTAQEVWGLWNWTLPLPVILLLVVGFIASLIYRKRITRYRLPVVVPVLLWTIILLLIQRVVPYARVFMFILPLYLVWACAGLRFLLCPLEQRLGIHWGGVFSAGVVLLCGGLSLNVVTSRALYYSEHELSLREGAQIADFAHTQLGPADRLYAPSPSNIMLWYHFRRAGYALTPLFVSPTELNSQGRLLIVVNEAPFVDLLAGPKVTTLDGILRDWAAQNGPSLATYSPPRLVQRYEFAALYELDPLSLPTF